jgi:hypothetical protein
MSDEPLSRPEIEALQRQLSLLSEPAVRDAYVQAHARCCLGRGELPKPGGRAAVPKRLEGSLAVGAERESEEVKGGA